MTERRAIVRAAARRDVARHAVWLLGEAGPQTARRFLEATQASFAALAETPGLGSIVPTRLPALAQAQKWRVQDFPDQLIFYLPRVGGGVYILRVLHAASNWRA